MIDLCHAVTSWDHELVDVEWEEKKENFLFLSLFCVAGVGKNKVF